MSDEELEKLAPWNESVKELCSVKQSKTLAFRIPSTRFGIHFQGYTPKLSAYQIFFYSYRFSLFFS